MPTEFFKYGSGPIRKNRLGRLGIWARTAARPIVQPLPALRLLVPVAGPCCRQICAFGASQPPADRPQLSPNMRLRRVRFASAIAAAPRSGRESIERTPEPEHHQGCSRSMVTAGVRHSLQRAGNICPHLALKSASHCSEHRKRTTAPLSTRSAPIYAVNRLVSCI